MMRVDRSAGLALTVALIVSLSACGREQVVDMEETMSQPQAFVGSDTCKQCHLEHFDSWKMTLHSRGAEDVRENEDAIIVPIVESKIREDLARLGDELEVPADEIHVPSVEEIRYTIGSQWKQRYVVEKDGTMYIAPIQYNVDTNQWVAYHETDWDQRPWLLKCGGCHTTGIDLEKKAFVETGVGCEACHGKGSWHAALPRTAVFEKRETIINPAKLTMGVAVQICGSCHNRGEATMLEEAEWPVGYEPGKALEAYFRSISFEEGDTSGYIYPNEFSKGHHQQYIDWVQSKHYKEGVTCTSCHYVHQIGIPPTRSQTLSAGSKQCFECHVMVNKVQSHSIHSFGNCIGCHMPRIIKSAVSGDIHSHVFDVILPVATIKDPNMPNSCTTCHKHKDDDLTKLMNAFDPTGEWRKGLPEGVGQSEGGIFGDTEAFDEAAGGPEIEVTGDMEVMGDDEPMELESLGEESLQ